MKSVAATSSPSLPATLTHPRLLTTDADDDLAISIDHWMSDLGLDNDYLQPYDWVQHKPSLDSNSDIASLYDPQHTASHLTPDWRWPSDGHFVSASTHRSPTVSRRILQTQGHRRALSNSTSTSHDTNSPSSYPVSLPQSTGFDYSGPLFDAGYGSYQPQTVPVQYQPYLAGRVPSNFRGRQAMSSSETVKAEPVTHQYSQQQPRQAVMSSYTQNSQVPMGQQSASRPFPKLDTAQSYGMGYQEDPYNAAASITSAPVPMSNPPSAAYNSPYSARPTTLTSRLQEAAAARASASPTQRQASPFRTQSPYANQADAYGPPALTPAAAQRQQPKVGADRHFYDQHHPQPDGVQPKTISPKDAVLDEFRAPGEDEAAAAAALFPPGSGAEQLGGRMYPANGSGLMQSTAFGYSLGPLTASGQQPMPKDFNYNPLASLHPSTSGGSQGAPSDNYPAHLASMETTKSENDGDDDAEGNTPRPANVTADSGTYSCTYHGCTHRFGTAAQLQKHKREAHRQPPNSHMQSPGGQSANQSRNSQAGPHRCDRINPSTGKPCNTVFSRPYDLTRHEDTIHAQRMKVRCQYCTEEKTFSRNDALTRHMRVVHPNIDFPGKHRKRHTE